MTPSHDCPQMITRRLVMPEEVDLRLRLVVLEAGVEPAEILRKALALFFVALDKKKQGLSLGFALSSDAFTIEVVGY